MSALRRLALLLALPCGCAPLPDFAQESLVDRPRVLALVAEPPEVAPGVTSELSALLALPPALQGDAGAAPALQVQLYRMLAGLTASSAKEVHGPAKAGEQIRSVVDPSRIKQELGCEVKVDLAEGLKQTVEYFQGKNR